MVAHKEKSYGEQRKKASEFKTRAEYLNHELTIMKFRRWRVNLPFRDYGIEIEDVVPALAATIQLSVPVIAILGGVVFLAEPVGLRLTLGTAAVLGGIALVIWSPKRL